MFKLYLFAYLSKITDRKFKITIIIFCIQSSITVYLKNDIEPGIMYNLISINNIIVNIVKLIINALFGINNLTQNILMRSAILTKFKV